MRCNLIQEAIAELITSNLQPCWATAVRHVADVYAQGNRGDLSLDVAKAQHAAFFKDSVGICVLLKKDTLHKPNRS